MIGEMEFELAIAEASAHAAGGDLFAYHAAGIDYPVVRAFGERFAQVKNAAAMPRDDAIVAAFLLAFRLGVLAARNELEED